VTWLPVTGGSSLDGFTRAAARQDMRRGEFEDTLGRITDGIFDAGLTLQAALDQSPDRLRQAAEHTLDLLDETVREARDAVFASRRRAAHGLADAPEPGAAARLTASAWPASRRATAGDLVRRSQLQVMQARRARARSQQARARALKLAVLSAAYQEQVAATLNRAASHPSAAARLRALSRRTASHAARARHWAQDRAPTG